MAMTGWECLCAAANQTQHCNALIWTIEKASHSNLSPWKVNWLRENANFHNGNIKQSTLTVRWGVTTGGEIASAFFSFIVLLLHTLSGQIPPTTLTHNVIFCCVPRLLMHTAVSTAHNKASQEELLNQRHNTKEAHYWLDWGYLITSLAHLILIYSPLIMRQGSFFANNGLRWNMNNNNGPFSILHVHFHPSDCIWDREQV